MSPAGVKAAAGLAAVCSSAYLLALLWRREQQQQPRNDVTTTTPTSIPPRELRALQSFLRRVYRWRGWQGGTFHWAQAWHAVQAAAATAEGGAWPEQFTGKQLTDANCNALLRLIDAQFFSGKLLKRLQAAAVSSPVRQQQEPATATATTTAEASPTTAQQRQQQYHTQLLLRCRVVQSWDAQWLAYFDTRDNVVYINCWRWSRAVSDDAPINCEGVVCVNRLQMLMHTLAHELVHAVVFQLFPDIDAASPAYTSNSRHGPIFQLLNKQLFGHASDALEHVRVLTCSAGSLALRG